jgi:hypothetical protein
MDVLTKALTIVSIVTLFCFLNVKSCKLNTPAMTFKVYAIATVMGILFLFVGGIYKICTL